MEMFISGFAASFALGIVIGFVVGYPLGLFIDKLDKKEKAKNVN
jgi:NhaP-type Na+/H+ or K+/H+ antiporter